MSISIYEIVLEHIRAADLELSSEQIDEVAEHIVASDAFRDMINHTIKDLGFMNE